MSSPADFLLARIDEDEEAARLATGAGPDWRAESRTVSDPAAGSYRAVARFLALPYAHHPDYRDEWRP